MYQAVENHGQHNSGNQDGCLHRSRRNEIQVTHQQRHDHANIIQEGNARQKQ